ncbi:MAG: sulfatase [Acidobacteria bacterium]|nr:sulfatase [Acidobacteriota bacterium]
MGAVTGAVLQSPQQPASRFNVLFLIADDLNNDLGAYGAPVRSPNIEQLASRGVRFDRAYTQYPLCSPSRSSMLTGRRPNATGVLTNPGKNPMSPHFREKLPDAVTLPQLFRTNGRFAARVGKLYHYGVPNTIGTGGLDDYPSWDLTINPRGRDREVHDRIFSLRPGQFGGTVSWLADDGPDAEHTDGIAAAEAVRLLERFKRNGQPFFLAVGFYRPHTPYVAPKRYFDLYPRDRIELPTLSGADRSRTPEAAYRSALKEQDAMTDDQRREAIQAYWASITFMDAQIGRVLDALDRLSLADSTIVVFTSDHGYHLGDHGLWQKMSAFERSARVPLIIAAPGAKARGAAARGLAELVDLYPTLADLTGLKSKAPLDGVSLAPMLQNPATMVKDAAFTQVRNGYAVRTDRWRYVEWEAGQLGAQLYDMVNDPAETTNLATDPRHAATVRDLRARLAAYRR